MLFHEVKLMLARFRAKVRYPLLSMIYHHNIPSHPILIFAWRAHEVMTNWAFNQPQLEQCRMLLHLPHFDLEEAQATGHFKGSPLGLDSFLEIFTGRSVNVDISGKL